MRSYKRTSILISVALSLGLTVLCYAQKSSVDGKAKPFRLTLFNEWKGPDLYVLEGKKFVPVKPAKHSYTQAFPCVGNQAILYQRAKVTGKADSYTAAVKVTVPLGLVEPLVILAWDPKASKAASHAVEFSPTGFPYGTCQIVNLCHFPLGGYMGDKTKKFLCKPRKSHITTHSYQEGEATPLVLYAEIGKDIQKVFGSITTHRSTKRSIFIIYPTVNPLNQVACQATVIVDHFNPQRAKDQLVQEDP